MGYFTGFLCVLTDNKTKSVTREASLHNGELELLAENEMRQSGEGSLRTMGSPFPVQVLPELEWQQTLEHVHLFQ